MLRLLVPAIVIASLVWPSAALGREPAFRSAGESGGHIVVAFSLGDLVAPAQIEVATRPVRDATDSFPAANVKLRERMTARPDPVTGLVHWRTRGVLVSGVYYVVVSGVADSATSCVPHYARCAEHWSNVLRVLIRGTRS